MAMKVEANSTENKLATTVEEIFITEQEIVEQSDAKKIRRTIDMLVIEIDHQKYEEYLSSGLVNLTEMQ